MSRSELPEQTRRTCCPDQHRRDDGELAAQAELLRDICGNPFREVRVNPTWLRWNDATVPKLAQGIYEERAFGRLPILRDALVDAGCDHEDFLAHCRSAGPHVLGCWAVDLLLEKA